MSEFGLATDPRSRKRRRTMGFRRSTIDADNATIRRSSDSGVIKESDVVVN